MIPLSFFLCPPVRSEELMRLLRDARIDGILSLLSSETATPSLSYFSTSVWVHPAGRLRAVWEEVVLCHAHNPLAHTAFLTMTRTRTSPSPCYPGTSTRKGRRRRRTTSLSHTRTRTPRGRSRAAGQEARRLRSPCQSNAKRLSQLYTI